LRSPLFHFGALSCAYFATIGLFNPFSSLWLQSLGFGTLAIGAIASLQAWTRVIVPYGWSWLGDHHGQRERWLRWACGGAVLCAAVLAGVREPLAITVTVVLLFAFNGGVVPLSEAAVSRHLIASGSFDAGRYGRMRLWGSMGFVTAVLLGGAALQSLGLQAFPWAVLLLCGLMAWAAWRLPMSPAAVASQEPAPPVLPRLREPAVAWFFASVALTVLAHSSLYAFFSLFLEEGGYRAVHVGLFWALSVGFEIAFFAYQGRWFGRLSDWQWLQIASATAALRFGLMAAAGAWLPALLLGQASHALSFAAHHAACTQWLSRQFPDRLRGRGQALYATLGYGLPGVAGGVGGGWLIGHAGFRGLFAAAALAAAAGLVCAIKGRQAEARSAGLSTPADPGEPGR
jgi:PPP family 3-phenylpropionic acid transporter